MAGGQVVVEEEEAAEAVPVEATADMAAIAGGAVGAEETQHRSAVPGAAVVAAEVAEEMVEQGEKAVGAGSQEALENTAISGRTLSIALSTLTVTVKRFC